MKKRKQHYVWEHYLTAWATNGQVWCLHDGRRFCTSTENVAQERDFYRLKEMSDADLAFVRQLVMQQVDPQMREMALGWIAPFQEVFELRRWYEGSGRKVPAFEVELDIAINNLEEDLHGKIETAAIPFLARLRTACLDLADDATFVDFAWFLGAQYMRTPRIMKRCVGAVDEMKGVNADAVWGLLRTIFASNIGFAIYARRHMLRATFLDAEPSKEFITGDQPIVNIRAQDGVSPPEEFELFYPVSPRVAVLLAFDGTVRSINRQQLGTGDTAAYNELIVRHSSKQIYAASEESLVEVIGAAGDSPATSSRL